jgi:hypothetical protein
MAGSPYSSSNPTTGAHGPHTTKRGLVIVIVGLVIAEPHGNSSNQSVASLPNWHTQDSLVRDVLQYLQQYDLSIKPAIISVVVYRLLPFNTGPKSLIANAMDPLSALSVAAAVVQFVDYSTRVVAKGSKLYKSAEGALSENIELQTASTRLQRLSGALQDSLRLGQQGLQKGPLGENDQALEDICEACVKVSKELVERLEKLKVPDGHQHRKWKSFRQALKTVCSKEKIEEVADRLAELRIELETYVILFLK